MSSSHEPSTTLERFTYDDRTPRLFLLATLAWGIIGMLVGLLCALQLADPAYNADTAWLSFGRIRALHTNAVIFAFAGNAFFTGCYYSIQRLLKTRLWSDGLSSFHFWGWQAIILGAAVTLPAGFTQSKEYAELEWPLDIAIAVVWIAFAINVFGTIARRRERHLYVAIWFYIASIVTVALLHIGNNLAMPAGLFKSYSAYAGVQDALMQWWYGHNAVAFFLTTPFLGLMYYFMPKAAERPVFSYRLSILHFWTLVFIYIWAGPHHLHYTALPEWASTLGMLFSVMLWMPSWGGMINGLLTLRGAWHKVAADPVLKFFVVAITFYGMATFEGPLMSIKSVNALSHYTDWTIAHVHAGALGWVGFMTFGMIYWLMPRLFQAPLWSTRLAEAHFWSGTVGILLYIVAIYAAGLTQGLMWMALDDAGRLAYPDFVETVVRLLPMYWVRVVGGSLYLLGALLCAVNLVMTWRARPATYAEPVHEAPALSPVYEAPAPAPSPLRRSGAHVLEVAYTIERFAQAAWHRTWERLPFTFTAATTGAVVIASAAEIVPLFLLKSRDQPTIASVTPYTPLEVLGRDLYIAEGCYTCHSQMVRPIRAETQRYGDYSKAGEFVHDHPFLWGSRRIGPDLHRVGGKYPHLWHVEHMRDPRRIAPGSIMPAYPWMLERSLDFGEARPRVTALWRLGVPYSDEEIARADDLAREQAERIGREIVAQGGPEGLEDKEIVALVAYLQRLGTDARKAPAPGGTK
ncbi:MAG: cytochrome-c oxidase, cbb3-type subunit I [Planctomycetes bacterium]|nr:cytochrome-c oxidase, cbb3-type subunit I [Planctomycetota bacterium]